MGLTVLLWQWWYIICYARMQTWNLLNPRIALLIPKIPGLEGDLNRCDY